MQHQTARFKLGSQIVDEHCQRQFVDQSLLQGDPVSYSLGTSCSARIVVLFTLPRSAYLTVGSTNFNHLTKSQWGSPFADIVAFGW